ncbi:hypothetical protein L204_105671 [Cryptococcus depauperatus]
MSYYSIPPVQAEYITKGGDSTLTGLETYAVGPEDAQVAVLWFDSFETHVVQTKSSGVDLIVSRCYRVVMPDFLMGGYATPERLYQDMMPVWTKYFFRFLGAAFTHSEPLSKSIAALKEAGQPEDVEKLNMRVSMISTTGEDVKVIAVIREGGEAKNPRKNVFKHYADMVHRFAAARADHSGGAATEAYRIIVKSLKNTFA